MIFYLFQGIIGLFLILFSCELFTNAIEWTGKKFKLNEGITGSILAAVGTALPETMVPIIAIVFIPGKSGEEIGIGAILGAPFMLSTLAFGITGLATIFYFFAKKRGLMLDVNDKILSNDILFFIVVYILAIFISLINVPFKKWFGILFFLIYALYVYKTFLHERKEEEIEMQPLYFDKRENPSLNMVIIQDIISLAGIIIGARIFVSSIEHISLILNFSPFLFSLFVAPIATELPEKFNSIIWIGKKKDTLALGNISGAMVFQSSIVVAFGVILTEWTLNQRAILSAALAIISSLIIAMYMKLFKKLHSFILLTGIIIYISYIVIILKFIK